MKSQSSVHVMVLIERRSVGKPRTYKTLSIVREGVGLVDLHPLTEHEQISTMDMAG